MIFFVYQAQNEKNGSDTAFVYHCAMGGRKIS